MPPESISPAAIQRGLSASEAPFFPMISAAACFYNDRPESYNEE